MTSILQYPLISGPYFTINKCAASDVVRSSVVYNWILFGKIAESGYAVPKYEAVFTTPSGKNRYLTDVVTAPIPASSMTAELAVAGVITFTVPLSATVVSSDPAVATATITNGTTTITGVAAGTATVTISDERGTTVSTVVVTIA